MWNELTFLWNELTILWNDLTIDWNDLTWNDLTMERNDPIPCRFGTYQWHDKTKFIAQFYCSLRNEMERNETKRNENP